MGWPVDDGGSLDRRLLGNEKGDGLKRFFDVAEAPALEPPSSRTTGTLRVTSRPAGARIAIYDGLVAAPRVEDVEAATLGDAIEQLASRTYNIARERGGQVPYTIIREVAENLIHAGFREVVVTILDDGNTVRFADQGPGIPDKEKAFLPGFSTATAEMKTIIRGVGSGLPIVRETLSFAGGTVEIDDNLGSGTVVTLRVSAPPAVEARIVAPEVAARLSDRQKQVLSIILEMGTAGPSVISRELNVGVATAYRDLAFLEDSGLIAADETGKRTLTAYGISCLEQVLR